MRKRAFTLVELLVVIAILAALAAILVVNYSGILAGGQAKIARAGIQEVENAVEMFRLEQGKLPGSLQDLVSRPSWARTFPARGYLKKIPRDPWDRPYLYSVVDSSRFTIRCLGADGVAGGDGADANLVNEDTPEGA